MSAKQFFKLVGILASAYWLCHGLLFISNSSIGTLIDDMLSITVIFIPVILAISFGLFTYVDNMAKELTDLRNEVDREKYIVAQNTLAAFKKEVLLNAGLVLVLCLLERAIKSVASTLLLQPHDWLQVTIFLSLRFALFATAMWATISQLKGFLVAVEYRTLIAINRK